MNFIGRKFLFGYREYIHTQEYLRCRQYPGGPLMYLYFYTQCVLAVPPIPRRPLIRNTYFIPEGSAGNTPEALHTKYLFHTRGYWGCRQYPGGPSYVILISYPRVSAVSPIPLILISTFIPEGIGGGGPSYVSLLPYPMCIGGATNTPEAPRISYISFFRTIINLEHINSSLISLNQDIYMWMQVVERDCCFGLH
jgi:hypothetical protein